MKRALVMAAWLAGCAPAELPPTYHTTEDGYWDRHPKLAATDQKECRAAADREGCLVDRDRRRELHVKPSETDYCAESQHYQPAPGYSATTEATLKEALAALCAHQQKVANDPVAKAKFDASMNEAREHAKLMSDCIIDHRIWHDKYSPAQAYRQQAYLAWLYHHPNEAADLTRMYEKQKAIDIENMLKDCR